MCRSLTSFVGLIDLAMNDFARNLIPASYAETAVLRSCASEVERWNERYQAAVNGAYDPASYTTWTCTCAVHSVQVHHG
jgi:hypothetical protein